MATRSRLDALLSLVDAMRHDLVKVYRRLLLLLSRGPHLPPRLRGALRPSFLHPLLVAMLFYYFLFSL